MSPEHRTPPGGFRARRNTHRHDPPSRTLPRGTQAGIQAVDRLRSVRPEAIERAIDGALHHPRSHRPPGDLRDRVGAEARGGFQIGGTRDRLCPRGRRHRACGAGSCGNRRESSMLTQPAHVKAAVAQIGSVPFDVDATVTKAENWIAKAGAESCRIVVFPEAFIAGYPEGIGFRHLHRPPHRAGPGRISALF